jgi:hypothetical protein
MREEQFTSPAVGLYLIVNHGALLLWNKLICQQAVGVALDRRDDATRHKIGV